MADTPEEHLTEELLDRLLRSAKIETYLEKAGKAKMLVRDECANIKENAGDEFFNRASDLLDAKGYYYLNIPLNENPDLYINENIKAIFAR